MKDKQNSFSIILPVHIHSERRKSYFYRALRSVITQTYDNAELIVINDGSTMEMVLPIERPNFRIFNQSHQERVIARNKGMEEAQNDWICWLDSDDIYLPHYLEVLNEVINLYPTYRVFNFGAVMVHKNYHLSIRNVFRPAIKEKGHEVFGSGTIMAGTFIYHRNCIKEVGLFPKVSNCWDLSLWAQKKFPEIKPLFTITSFEHPKGYPKELGNPWGEDYLYFYMLTRIYNSQPIDIPLYAVYGKYEHEVEI